MSVLRHFEFQGQSIRVECASSAWADGIHEILGAYRCQALPESSVQATLLAGRDDLRVPRNLEERGRFGDLVFHYHPASQGIWIEVHGRGWVQVELTSGRIQATLDYDPREDEWFVAHHAFYPALLEILKARGHFPVHSGLVARGEDGLLMCGASGSGKTTLCLNLASHGWEFLADDTCFLRAGDEGVDGLAFWEDLHVTDETLERFDSLSFLKQQIPRRENWKRHFAVEQLAALRPRESCRPRWLVFPRVGSTESSELRAIRAQEALLRLMPQSMIAVHPGNTERQLELLARLMPQLVCYEFSMGPDLQEVRDCLDAGLMETSP